MKNAVRFSPYFFAAIALIFFASPFSFADRGREETVKTLLRVELLKHYPGSRIDLLAAPRSVKGNSVAEPSGAVYLGDNGRGEAFMKLTEVRNSQILEEEVLVPFSAAKAVPVAQRRIRPGEKLVAEAFAIQEINLANSPHREVRGLILGRETALDSLEANQTLLEGQYVLSSAVRRAPDVQRGSPVKIHLLSGGLVLTTMGNAEEPGSIGQSLRVISGKGKKQFVGKLQSDYSVEVSL